VRSDGLGGIDVERFSRALDQIAITYQFKNRPKPADIFDGSFLPADAERKLD
jgi:NitT/TauT family transport system substrate-binding protein